MIAASELRQVGSGQKAADGETRNPRERLVLPGLAADREHDYRIRIRHSRRAASRPTTAYAS